MRRILRGEPDAIVSWALYLLVGGMAMIGMSRLFDGHGIIAGFFAASLGAAGASLEHWRSERGLWMLAALFFAIYAFVYACFCIGHFQQIWLALQPNDPVLVADVSIGTVLLVANLRFLAQVAKNNYSLPSIGEE